MNALLEETQVELARVKADLAARAEAHWAPAQAEEARVAGLRTQVADLKARIAVLDAEREAVGTPRVWTGADVARIARVAAEVFVLVAVPLALPDHEARLFVGGFFALIAGLWWGVAR